MSFFVLKGPNKGKDITLLDIEFSKGVAELSDETADKVENMLTKFYSCVRHESLPKNKAKK